MFKSIKIKLCCWYCLVGVSLAREAKGDTQHVPVPGKADHRDRVTSLDARCSSPSRGSVGEIETSLASVVGEQVPVELELQGCVVDSGEVAGSTGLRVLRVEGERVRVHVSGRNQRVVLVRLDKTEVSGLGLGETALVVQAHVDRADRVERASGEGLHKAGKVEVLAHVFVKLLAAGPEDLDDGVVEVEVESNTRGAVVRHGRKHLDFVHENLERSLGKLGALLNVQVHVLALERAVDVRVTDDRGQGGTNAEGGKSTVGETGIEHRGLSRADDGAERGASGVHDGPSGDTRRVANGILDTPPRDLDANIVELERHKGKCVTRRLGKEEGERHVEATEKLGASLGQASGVLLTNHLLEAATDLAGKLLPHEEVVRVESIDRLRANEKVGFTGQELSNRVGPVRHTHSRVRHTTRREGNSGLSNTLALTVTLLVVNVNVGILDDLGVGLLSIILAERFSRNIRDTGKIDQKVHVVHKITTAVQAHGRRAANVAVTTLEVDLLRLQGEVGMPHMLEAPESNAGGLVQVFVQVPLGNELRDSTNAG